MISTLIITNNVPEQSVTIFYKQNDEDIAT